MAKIEKFPEKCGGFRGFLPIYILHSLKKTPKSGYELIKEITNKTAGDWVPSKGNIYPLLNHLKEEELVRVKELGKRSKRIFEVTGKGRALLKKIEKTRGDRHKSFRKFRNLFMEVVGEKEGEASKIIFDINNSVFDASKENEERIIPALKECLRKLKKINSQQRTHNKND